MFNSIISEAKKNIPVVEGDYQQNGLWYCGKCHTPKEIDKVVDIAGTKKHLKTMCLCACATAERDAVDRARAEEQRRIATTRRRVSGFPDAAMMEWTFDKDDGANPKLSSLCKKYVDNFDRMFRDGKGLLFYGTVGTGKTFMASCIANALIDQGKSCLVTNFARITNELQAHFNDRQEYYDTLNRYDLLVIDDLAAERDTEYMGEVIMNVIDSRYRVKKPLIITTNLSGQDLNSPSGIRKSRVYSRLLEMCLTYEVKGKDRRRNSFVTNRSEYDWLFE